MAVSFSPSINIIRDRDKKVGYIPTNNSKQIYQSIATNFKIGVHSFTIIGSYGTGKSAFLLALKNTLEGSQIFFERKKGDFNDLGQFEFANIVGTSNSIIQSFANYFNVEVNSNKILKHLQKKLSDSSCLVIIIDEFGKFLEFAATTNPDKELYFIQELAELANSEDSNLLFITTLHQNFDAYSLEPYQKKEWEKVKGRLKELTFNEPVEQLLVLAGERISQKFALKAKPDYPEHLLKIIETNRIFPLKNKLSNRFIQKLYPFDIISAAMLTIGLQRYGQNERSLFTFLDTDEYRGLQDYDVVANPYYNLACLYDYLYHNYYSTLTSRNNHDYRLWTLIRNSLERVEANFEDNLEAALKLVKTIGLLNALGSKAAKINKSFLDVYSKTCLGVENIDYLLGQLQGFQIIKYRKYKDSFILYEGSDIDIEAELNALRSNTGDIKNIAFELKTYLPLDYAPAKAASYKKGTPRFFQFEISEIPLKTFHGTEIDGFVNLIFSQEQVVEDILTVQNQPILFAFFVETPNIKQELHEIKVIDSLFKKIDDYKDPAKAEVENERSYRIHQLKSYLNTVLFNGSGNVRWFFEGKEISIKNRTDFNKTLSVICEAIYPKTPVLRSELMNKHKLSSNISHARKKLIGRLLSNHEEEDLGFESNEFPPEKAIYYALLKDTGIHKQGRLGIHYFGEPFKESSFNTVWQACNDFLESARVGKRGLNELIDILSAKPFKLKNGFLEFWIPIFLFAKREEYALYYDNVYVPYLNLDILDIINRDIHKYQIKTFHIEGIRLDLFNKYRELIRQPEEEEVTESTFINTVKPFIVFYKNVLNDYARKTQRISKDAKAFRGAVKNAKELEQVFFEDLLTNFGVSLNDLAASESNLNGYIIRLRDAMRELSTAFPNMIERVEEHILEELGLQGKNYKQYVRAIQKRYTDLKPYLLTDKQKIFRARLFSQFEEAEKYFNSISSALVGKGLERLNDEEEIVFHNRLKESFRELDNLLEIANLNIEEDKGEALQIEITGLHKKTIRHKIILSKMQSKKAVDLEGKLKKALNGSDSKVSQAVLIKLLQEQLNGKSNTK